MTYTQTNPIPLQKSNSQFILVRLHNTDNPYCHLVYNRIGYNRKVISSQGDYKRNEIATKRLKGKYGLTYAKDKGKTNVEKLHTKERIRYEIHNAVRNALKYSKTWKQFNDNLDEQGIKLEFVKRSREIKTLNDIQGIHFAKDGLTFKASQISREFGFAKLNTRLSWNRPETEQDFEVKKQKQKAMEYGRQAQGPPNNAFTESNGLRLLSPFGGSVPEGQAPYDELFRRHRKKKKRKGLGS